MKMVALIPARVGSKRCPGKNTRLLAGHPLIAYTIAAAQESGVFSDIRVCTDDPKANLIAVDAGVNTWTRGESTDDEPDIAWVREFFGAIAIVNPELRANAFAILRPTSPFRTAETIKRAHAQFFREEIHSLRAVQPAREHPGKMWTYEGPGYPIVPVLDRKHADGVPWHSSPTQTLPKVYVQNASLEMAWTYVLESFGTISGRKVAPFFTEGFEGFDINTEEDFRLAEVCAANTPDILPRIHAHR